MSKNKNYIMIMVALIAVLMTILPVSAAPVVVGKNIGPGATVFLGEEGLNVTSAMGGLTTIGYWAPGAVIGTTAPSITIPIPLSSASSFPISASIFKNYIGNWYRVTDAGAASDLAFRVAEPVLTLSIKNADTLDSIDGKTVVAGTPVTFSIDTNIRLDSNRGDIVSVAHAPIADFSIVINATTGCVTFTDLSVGSTFRSWAFDGVVSSDASRSIVKPPITVPAVVKLIVSNNVNNGVGETASSRTVTVGVTGPVYSGSVVGGTAPSDPIPITAPYSLFSGVVSGGGNVVLSDHSTGSPAMWGWDFGDGNTSTLQNPVYQYSPVAGVHTIMLTTGPAATSPSSVSAIVTVNAPSYTLSTTPGVYVPPVPADESTAGIDYTKGYMDIIVKSESGATYSSLQTLSGTPASLQKQFVNTNPYYWNNHGSVWATAALSGAQRMYQSGVYQVWVECNLNGMKDNYKDGGGAYYTGKTVSSVSTLTLGSDTLGITINKASVVRGKPFAVTITGAPRAVYSLWVKGSYPAGTAPVISDFQEGVNKINSTFASITTDVSGRRIVGFTTSSDTKEQKFTIRVESTGSGQVKSDEVAINIAKGGLTLVAAGTQNYYLGEDIKLSGTNSESETTYLFIVGPNLDSSGAQLNSPRESVNSYNPSTFTDVTVDDGSYTYTWSTSGVDLDSGTYTIYGVSQPVDRSELQNTSYATVSVIIKKPYVSANANQPIIAKGDRLYIEGDAQGDPSSGVAIWILGKNYAKRYTQSIDSDSTYKYEIPGAETSSMASGQYFIVVQHPMQNGVFDIDISGDYVYNKQLGTGGAGTTIFKLYGSGSLQGSDAAEALIQAISDPNVDDTYTKLVITVAEPLISINQIGDRHVGDKFNISGKTNLAVDDEILIEVYSSSFKPTQKIQSGEFSGTTGTVKVVKGEGGMNTFSLNVDTSTFKLDEYIVIAQSIVQDSTGTALFNMIEGASTNPVVTPPVVPVVTAPVVIVTAIPTVPPTAPPTAIPTTIVPTTTKSPGFGAVFALIGLGAVAFMVVRRD